MRLVEVGFLEVRTGPDGTMLYRVNRSRLSEFQRGAKASRYTEEGGHDERYSPMVRHSGKTGKRGSC